MTDPWPLRSSLELGALSTAVPCACLHVKHVLKEWGLDSLAESAELLVAELVTSAVNADPQPPPTKGTNDDGASAGTGGVLVVAALSTRWNWYLTEEPPGKVVWCELAAGHSGPPTQPQATQPPTLPRRVPRARPK